MVASTRFRRLFASSGAYTLFMPAVIKVYTESEQHTGIRLAIEYAITRFFAHHRESFVFQSLDVMSHIIIHPQTDRVWVAKSVYSLFSILHQSHSAATPDPAGIHDINRTEERKVLMVVTAEEKPQTFLASVRKVPQKKKVDVVQPQQYEYERKRLSLDDFVRLFFTVIAHDFTAARAEHFMAFLLYMTPHLYHSSNSARRVLTEGVDALCIAMSKLSSRPRPGDASSKAADKDEAIIPKASEEIEHQLSDLAGESRKPGNILAMQITYFSIVCAFVKAGGDLPSSVTRRIMELVKTILREASVDTGSEVTTFLVDFSRLTLLHDSQRPIKSIISFLSTLAPILSAYALTLDLSGVIEVLTELCRNPVYSHNPAFSQIIVTQICSSLLSACQVASSDKQLLTLPCRLPLISLLAEAVFLRGASVLDEVEKCPMNYEFLAGILIPFVLSMKSCQQTRQQTSLEPWQKLVQEFAWARTLVYAMSAGRKVARRGDSQERRRSSDSRLHSPSNGKGHVPTFCMALQAIKIIIVKGEQDISNCLPDVWSRLSIFIKGTLAEGNAKFALRGQDWSPLPSPTHSPRASMQLDSPINSSFASPNPFADSAQSYASPRVVDYCLWSVLELLCRHRTPLLLQLRPLMQENLVNLAQEVRHQSRRGNSDRRVSSVFSKPRRLSSHYGPPSPKYGSRMSSSQSLAPSEPGSPGIASLDTGGLQNIVPYQSNSPQKSTRIVHLGLVPNQHALSVPPSPGGSEDVKRIVRSSKIRSMVLIKETYRRIRTVQACMGYHSEMLPLPSGAAPENEDLTLTTWSTGAAVQAIVQETQRLMEEFEETFAGDASFIDGEFALDS
jgi:hypothetical protein